MKPPVLEGESVALYSRHRYLSGVVKQAFPVKRSGEQVVLIEYITRRGTKQEACRVVGSPERVEIGSVAVCCRIEEWNPELKLNEDAPPDKIQEVKVLDKYGKPKKNSRVVAKPKACSSCGKPDKMVLRNSSYWCTYCHKTVVAAGVGQKYEVYRRVDQDKLRLVQNAKWYHSTQRRKWDQDNRTKKETPNDGS